MASRDGFKLAAAIRRGEMDDELPDYDVIVSWITRCPITWIGGILATAVGRAATYPLFKDDDALAGFVARSIDNARNPTNVLRDSH